MSDDEQSGLPPEPEDSGVRPEQERGEAEQPTSLVPTSPTNQGIEEYPMSETVGEIAEMGGVRGQAGMMLLIASMRKLEIEIQDLKRDHRLAVEESSRWREAYHENKEQAAVLTERMGSLRRLKNLKQVVATLGGLAIGVAGPLAISTQSGGSIAVLLLGVVLFLAGWWPTSIREDGN